MSILRSSRFLRNFFSYTRNIAITRHAAINSALLENSKILVNAIHSYSTRPFTKKSSTVENSLQKLDHDVRRTGRISWRGLEGAFNEIRNSKQVTSTQALMIIRCCGNIVPEESPESRTKFVNKIWSTLEKNGVPLDVSHYNALLRVYLENEHRFSPSEFLADLQSKGVEPNRVTYQRLIAAYCQNGDIEGATRILEYMKEKQIPVNESVFNSLILGHFQAGDVKSAVGMLGVMKQANIKPSNETYTTLMCGHAKTGDCSAISEILAQCEQEEDVFISDRDILEVMYTLAVNNHIDLIDQLSNHLKKDLGFNQDAKNVVLRLIVKGQDAGATKIFRLMTPLTPAEGENPLIGNFLIRQMVKSGRPVKSILDLCNELKSSGENESALFIATEASLVNNTPETSLKLLTAISKDHEVCFHYYWPVLVQYGKKRDTKGITNTLLQMAEEIGQPVNNETLRDYVVPYLPQNVEGVNILRMSGISPASGAAAMVAHLIFKNDLKNAAKIGLSFRANYSSAALCKSLVSSFVEKQDLESFITLVRVIEDGAKEENVGLSGKILLDVVLSLRKNRAQTIRSVLEAYLNSGLAISTTIADEIQNSLNGEDLTSEIVSLLSQLTSSDLTPSELNRPTTSIQTKFLDEPSFLRAISTSKEKGDPAWGLKRQLLSSYCLNKELEKAEKLKKEMEEDGFEFQVGYNVMMLDLYVHHEKLHEALAQYNKIFEHENVEIDPNKILRLVALMVKGNMIEEAYDLLSKRKVNPTSQINGRSNFSTGTLGWKILNIFAENKDVENTQKMFDKLIENNFVTPSNIVLGPLIKVHILRDDIDSALKVFEECCTKYRATPWKNELACKLILKEDPVALQRLTDLSTEIHGEINSLYDLVLSFVECGKIRQARKILETPGLKNRSQRLSSASERYDSEGHVNHLENLVEVTKDLSHIDRAEIYYHLLSTYCKNDEVDKAMGLWTQMQDEDVQPSEQFLQKLGNLLKQHDRPVPFAIPNPKVMPVEQVKRNPQVGSLALKNYRAAVNAKDADEAIEYLNQLKVSELSNTDRSGLLTLLMNNGRLGEAKKLLIDWMQKNLKVNVRCLNTMVNSLAQTGDVETLDFIGEHIDEKLKRMTSFINRYTHCMVEAGRGEEVLAMLESKIKEATTPEQIATLQTEFPKGGIFSIFQSTQLLGRFEELAKIYREKGLLDPTNILWAHYTISGNTEKAEEAWSYLKPSERLLFQPVLKHCRVIGDLSIIEKLLSQVKDLGLPPKALGLIYSYAIEISHSIGKTEECEQYLERGIKDCTIDNLRRGVLYKVKNDYELNGKEFKYTIPSKQIFSTKSSSSSSSSDSDSDNEKTVKKAMN